jgi:hypothetical protein
VGIIIIIIIVVVVALTRSLLPSRCSATSTATRCTSTSATAPYSDDTKRSDCPLGYATPDDLTCIISGRVMTMTPKVPHLDQPSPRSPHPP